MEATSIPEAAAGFAEGGGQPAPSIAGFQMGYAAEVTERESIIKDEARRVGLCFDCLHSQRIQSPRGSIFYRCKLSDTDPSFPKYPRLPVLHCVGYRQRD